jgi:hypothetical protein
MKTFRKVLLGVVAIIAMILIIPIFTKKEYAVEREISINKPKAQVFEYIKYLKNQNNFSVWARMDPNMKKEFSGTDGTVGFVSAWDSQDENVGKGEQEIKKIKEGDRIDYELRFIKPFEATDYAYMITESENENATKVKWGFDGKMDYPMNFMLLVMDMDKMLGKDLETGLRNLKANLEK